MARFILLSGISGAGKSTYRDALVAANPDLVVASSDDLLDRFAEANGISYSEAFLAHHIEAQEQVYAIVDAAVADGRDVLWDQTNLSVARRSEALTRAGDHITIAVGVEAPWGVIVSRIGARREDTGKDIPMDVLEKQRELYERPHFDEGFDHVVIVKHPGPVVERIA